MIEAADDMIQKLLPPKLLPQKESFCAMNKLTWNRNLLPELLNARAMVPPPLQASEQSFEACASTASLFLYTQGPTILCLHHDTLALERRFENHQQNISFISVDNVSERGQGRLVVSYDVGQTAIVWDLFTGTEIARFTSFEPLLMASWMRNGSVVFGMFCSTLRERGLSVAVLRMAADKNCRKYKRRSYSFRACDIRTYLYPYSARTNYGSGSRCRPPNIRYWVRFCQTQAKRRRAGLISYRYQNGSIVIATLHPSFNVLHTLNTPRGPSPVIGLAWHTSSAKQKSDMLASQAMNGDLRVWSVSKPPEKETPRTIRVLKRPDTEVSGPQWMAWSKNGKIVQYMSGYVFPRPLPRKHC